MCFWNIRQRLALLGIDGTIQDGTGKHFGKRGGQIHHHHHVRHPDGVALTEIPSLKYNF